MISLMSNVADHSDAQPEREKTSRGGFEHTVEDVNGSLLTGIEWEGRKGKEYRAGKVASCVVVVDAKPGKAGNRSR